MDKFSFSLPNNKEYVIAARLMATSLAGVAGFDVEKIEDIRLAVGEACNNAVVHGQKSQHITMDICLEDAAMTIQVTDQGKGFDPKQLSAIDLEHYEGSGLGLFIIDSVMDQVDVKSTTERGTVITMTKKK